MKMYHHKQVGTVIWVSMLVGTVVFVILGLAVFRPLLAAVPIFAICGWLFYSLSIEVTDKELHWRFGPGLVRRRVPLSEIASAQPVRTNVIEGWGIHCSRFGWLYNVSGFDAVAITLRNGKQFALGTDEPQKLASALQPSHSASV
jgi:hypothetical protein